jgi:hypothetical protein
VDVIGYAFRVLDRSALPYGAIAYKLAGRDVEAGSACGSGGSWLAVDDAITDASTAWTDWYGHPSYAMDISVPNNAYATLEGVASLLGPRSDVTVVLRHIDASNGCTIDVYWDHLLLTPLAVSPPIVPSIPGPTLTPACENFTVTFDMPGESGNVTYSSPGLPAGAELKPAGGTGATLDWTPADTDVRRHDIMLRAENMDGAVTWLTYPVEVIDPVLSIDPIPDVLVTGGDTVKIDPVFGDPCGTAVRSATGLPAGASFDNTSGQFTWNTTPDDFGIYDVTFTLTDPLEPLNKVSRTARIIVAFEDTFESFTGYTEHNVFWGMSVGPVTWTVESAMEPSLLHSHSDLGFVVLGRAIRVLDRSAAALSAVDYELRARDVVVGTDCGSGGLLQLFGQAINDPAAAWPDWYTGPVPFLSRDVNDDTFTTLTGVAPLPSSSDEITLVMLHNDSSNICTIDVYWDRVRLEPVP